MSRWHAIPRGVSVERLMNPKLIGKPVLIGGTSDRGVVASCSYEARKFGVSSAMPMRMALNLCGDAIVVRGDMEEYSKYSRMVTEIIAEKAPVYEKASIDEHYLEAMLNAAELLIHPLGSFDEAIRILDQALESCQTADDIADASVLKVDALLQQGDRAAASELDLGHGDGRVVRIGHLQREVEAAVGRDVEHALRSARAGIDQRLGVAEKLFFRFRSIMRRQGVRMLIVDTQAENLSALRFFRKMGFGNPSQHIYLSLNMGGSQHARKKPTA